MIIPLSESVSVLINADGTGTGILQPNAYGEQWTITRMATSAPNACKLRVYRDVVSVTSKVDSTYAGSNDISDCNIVLGNANRLIFQWTDGTPGDYATIRIDGTKDTGRF